MATTKPTRLALHAATPRLGNVAANVAAVAKAAAADKADLVVFPEMFLSGYNIGDDAQRLALTLDDELLDPLRAAAKKSKTHIVAGGPRKVRAGVTANSAFLIRPDGTTEAYDKRVLANYTTFQEGLFFQPGRTTPVFDLPFGKVGLSICYDLFFPEFQRRQVLNGADLLLNISASPTTSQRFFEALIPARAIENACFVAYTNLVGPQDGIVFWGGAQAWTPRAHRLGRSEPMKPGKVLVDLDWDDLTPAREFRPTLRDVRSEDLGDLGA
ncbi:MAG: carbon-nitrogen hydrolase family protein [Candidatus Thermoplasmatota archaeon]